MRVPCDIVLIPWFWNAAASGRPRQLMTPSTFWRPWSVESVPIWIERIAGKPHTLDVQKRFRVLIRPRVPARSLMRCATSAPPTMPDAIKPTANASSYLASNVCFSVAKPCRSRRSARSCNKARCSSVASFSQFARFIRCKSACKSARHFYFHRLPQGSQLRCLDQHHEDRRRRKGEARKNGNGCLKRIGCFHRNSRRP